MDKNLDMIIIALSLMKMENVVPKDFYIFISWLLSYICCIV